MAKDEFKVYPVNTKEGIPTFKVDERLTSLEGYETDPDLVDAINVAINLGQPLIVTGEPGTGKTLLAHSIAYHYNFNKGEAFTFNTKSGL